MAQGGGKSSKLAKASKSMGSQRRKKARAGKCVKKGPKTHKQKRHVTTDDQSRQEVTKQINLRNEQLTAAKAVSVGTKFFLKDISQKGSQEHNQQIQARDKKQNKSTKMSDRVRDQLRKMGKDV